MIAVAAVAVAAVSQAAMFSWSSDSQGYALDAAGVTDNGVYAASSSVYMKGNGTWNYALTIFAAGTSTVVDSFEGALTVAGSKKLLFTTSESTKVADGTAYDYVLKITGTQTALNARGKEAAYDYTDAALAYEYAKSSITTTSMGLSEITGIDAPTSWTVSGIEAVPEPTSAMLLLLGVAGLALKRKQK